MNNSTNTNKPSAVENLKEKAVHLVEKVTGKPHGHHDTTTHTETLGHNNTLDHTKDHHVVGSNKDHHIVGSNNDHHIVGSNNDHHIVGSNKDHPTVADQNNHGNKINTSALLSSIRLPNEGTGNNVGSAVPGNVAQPDVVHDPSRSHAQHPLAQGNYAPGYTDAHTSHDLTNATAGVGHGASVTTNTHSNPAAAGAHVPGQVHHQHHKVDDPQHGITSRLVGGPHDPNNLEPAHLKPTM